MEKLKEKQMEYEGACVLRQALFARVDFLESLASESSRYQLAQQIFLRTTSLRSPLNVRSQKMAISNTMSIEALPFSIGCYDDKLLDRIAGMSLGDCVSIYRDFMSR